MECISAPTLRQAQLKDSLLYITKQNKLGLRPPVKGTHPVHAATPEALILEDGDHKGPGKSERLDQGDSRNLQPLEA